MPEARLLPDLARCAFFFDLDGTLAPLAPTPDAARVPAGTIALLQRLQHACGAVAIVSGRSQAVIDQMLAPLRLPVSGLHGAQWRGPDGRLWELSVNEDAAGRLLASLSAIADRYPGIRLEDKGLSYALHYRQAPEREAEIRLEACAAAEAVRDDYVVQYGKMVVEVKPRGVDKGQALERFMETEPFAARLPVMAGDDLTDEPAFAVVAKLGGLAIKIGEGPSCARANLADPAALARWLEILLPPAGHRTGPALGN